MNASRDIAARVAALDWAGIGAALDAQGYATAPRCLSAEECAGLIASYAQPDRFRRRIVMQQHGYGAGEYQYFAYPLPPLIAELRTALYASLVSVANR